MKPIKLLVFSDTHGDAMTVRLALSLVRDADYIVHAGDGAASFPSLVERYPTVTPVAVRGNCDLGAVWLPNEAELTVGNVRILIVHGHKFGVKSSLLPLEAEARRRGFGLVIFGHTHERCERYIPGDGGGAPLYLFNPGAGLRGEFGVISINGSEILLSHGSVYGQEEKL